MPFVLLTKILFTKTLVWRCLLHMMVLMVGSHQVPALTTTGNYCNFEFSCTGVCLAAIGPSVASRTPMSSFTLCSIIRVPTSGYAPFTEQATGNRPWQLTVTIPAAAFNAKSPLSTLQNFRFNVFKCGDKVCCLMISCLILFHSSQPPTGSHSSQLRHQSQTSTDQIALYMQSSNARSEAVD